MNLFKKMQQAKQPKIWTTPAGYSQVIYAKIAKETHTLIAGATGSGKSVMLNGIISQILYDAPSQSRFVLIDLKRVELSRYQHLPHTITTAKTAQDAVNALEMVSAIMDRRYKQMEYAGQTLYRGAKIYVIIDELADLLLSAEKHKLEKLIQHIAQLGRAAEIHLIVATQAPSRKILIAPIVLNMTCRIALRCDSAIESRQICNYTGAETLPKYGRCLYKSPDVVGQPELWTVPMIPDSETARLINHWMCQVA